jgi:hypothetical protein
MKRTEKMKTKAVSIVLIISTLIGLFFYSILQANSKIDPTNLFIVKDKDKFGIISKNDKYVLNKEFDYIDRLSEGYARVLKEDKWGFIDERLNLKIATKYDYANNFKEGYAAVKIGNKWGFIDSNNAIVIAAKYDWVSNFDNNIAIVKKDEEFYYIDKNENNVFNKSFLYAGVFSSGIAMVQSDLNNVDAIDYKGNTLFTLQTKEFTMIDKFYEERLVYGYKTKENVNKYGFFDIDNKMIAQGFDKLTYFKNGIAFYANLVDKKTLWGIVNATGKIVTSPIFNNVVINSEPFYGASIIDNNGIEKWGFINSLGDFVIEPIFDSIGTFNNRYGFVALKKDNELKWGIIDKYNVSQVECKYQLIYPFSD